MLETAGEKARRDGDGEVTAPLQSQAGAVNFRYRKDNLVDERRVCGLPSGSCLSADADSLEGAREQLFDPPFLSRSAEILTCGAITAATEAALPDVLFKQLKKALIERALGA